MNDDTIHLTDRGATIAGKPCSYSTPLPHHCRGMLPEVKKP